MNFRILLLASLILITGCAAPGTALLSPAITGAKTKSIQQASLSLASSLSSNQFIKKNEKKIKDLKINMTKKSRNILSNLR